MFKVFSKDNQNRITLTHNNILMNEINYTALKSYCLLSLNKFDTLRFVVNDEHVSA